MAGVDVVTTSMVGELDWNHGEATCELDIEQTLGPSGISQSGSICGHEVSGNATFGP